MSYQTEFSDFPAADMPAIPAGFTDESWHNDACPRFDNAELGLTLWIDFLNPAERETAGGTRFILCSGDDKPDSETIESDDIADINEAIELARIMRAGGYYILTDDSDKRATAYHVMIADRRIHLAYSKIDAADFIRAHHEGKTK